MTCVDSDDGFGVNMGVYVTAFVIIIVVARVEDDFDVLVV